MGSITGWGVLLDGCFAVFRFVILYILSILYRGKGKTVPPVTNPLLLKSATQLAREIREGKLKSEHVVQAYIDRIVEVNPYINSTVECCFTDALKKSREADSLIASGTYSKKQLADEKPLLGIPFSVKVVLKVKGLLCTAGSRLYLNKIGKEDAKIVVLMKNAGAIIIATTNVPEFGLMLDTTNLVHGTTCNPYDTNRTCGASSGGESALISAGGSVLGLGNDGMGSNRMPANFTGIFTHMPSPGLTPDGGTMIYFPEEVKKLIFTGPICRYAEDLITSMKVLSSRSEVPIDFEQQVDLRKLKICYLTEIKSPFLTPVDENIVNALKNAASHFAERYGVVTNEVKMPFLYDATRCVLSAIIPYTARIQSAITQKIGARYSTRLDFLKLFFGKSFLSIGPLITFNFSYFPLWYRESQIPYYKKMVEKWITEFDRLLDKDTVLLMPTFPTVAPRHFGMIPLLPNTCYMSIFNILGLPSTQCPIGYNKEGLPYGIQIISRKNNDVLNLACAVELEKAFGGWKSPGTV